MDAEGLKSTVEKVNSAISGDKVEEAISLLRDLSSKPSPSEDVLRVSKAGAAVNKLRKNSNKEIVQLATDIIDKWKRSVDANKKRKREAEESSTSGAANAAQSSAASGSASNGVSKAEGSSAAKTDSTIKSEDGKAEKKQKLSDGSQAPPPPKRERKLSTIVAEPGPERSAKTDKPDGLRPKYLPGSTEAEDKVRDRGVTMYYDALAFDSIADSTILVERAVAVEQAVFEKMKRTTGNEYRARVRELFLNLREPSNAALRDSIVTGAISAKTVVNYTQEELASEAIKAEQAAIDKQNLFAAQSAGATEAETDAFKCGKCGQSKTRYYQMQTRSADEPMTVSRLNRSMLITPHG